MRTDRRSQSLVSRPASLVSRPASLVPRPASLVCRSVSQLGRSHSPLGLVAVVALALGLGVLTSACVRHSEVIFEDTGALCPVPEGYTGSLDATMVFEAGGAITFRVAYEGCLSSSCDINREMSCEVVTDGTEIVVHSQGRFTERDGLVSCTEDCGLLEAECDSGPLPAGDYVIVHGEDRFPLTVPSAVQGLCEAPYL